ncbi:TPA: DUF4752 domain-containing protein [Salmonella enterica]|nr:DUF4752 domain-containing protein [Salmonella enterica]HEA0341950.1 DUF4752 domain-containing protein [Salmonella enterica]HEA0356849.1 DUF4752 domain-containing protein [Salmonella enterica]HEA2070267.1 DUF4752 domain-containing protein [Salmonella enterica]
MKERGITDGLTVNQLAERNAEHVTTIAALESRCAALSAKLSMINDLMEATEQANKLAQEATEKLVQERNALAAENVGLKSAAIEAKGEMEEHHDADQMYSYDADGEQMDALLRLCDAQGAIDEIVLSIKTPATDAFLAEMRASARNEGINYAASRLAAAFNHGFLDKPVSEVLDVTRMILSAKEDLANDPLPADDGLSGEYAEKAIEEWAAQLRKGVAQ